MAIFYTGHDHDTPGTDNQRDYTRIQEAGAVACKGVQERSIEHLAKSISLSYELQLEENMQPLPPAITALAYKYSGGGNGGYALYLFPNITARDAFVKENENALAIEPYLKPTY